MRKVFIYILIDPITDKIRYVGKTIMSLNRRLNCHMQEKRLPKRNSHKVNWVKSLKSKNLKPIIKSIETCNESNWQEREKYWIKYYKGIRENLTNHSVGGEGPVKNKQGSVIITDKQKKQISKSLKKYFRDNPIGKRKCSEHGKLCRGIRKRNAKNTYIGVSRYSINKWRATYSIGKKQIRIGTYSTELEALQARNSYVSNLVNKQIGSQHV